MSDIEIFKKAMLKALEKNNDKDINGWSKEPISSMNESMGEFIVSDNSHFADIFCHDFAKAFWGEEKIKHIIKNRNLFEELPVGLREQWISLKETELEVWQYHLQQLVLCENPLTYLERFL